MFLLRSAFWLTVAFMVIRPDVDVASVAASVSADAMAQGSSLIAEQINAIECGDLQCHGGKAIAAAALKAAPQNSAAVQATPAAQTIPLPRPRPDRAV